MTVAFTCAVFLGALLLFLVQPMMGKVLLPLLGGAPGVWNVCMVSFQVLLLAAYLYAHLLSRLRPRTQVAVHSALALAVVLALPIGLAEGSLPPVDGSPVFWVLVALARSVGLPFFMLAATAPLVQRWLSLTDHRSAADPYFLYAASNAGSLLALLSYPLLLEPTTRLSGQRLGWSALYIVAAGVVVLCGLWMLRRPGDQPAGSTDDAVETEPASLRERLLWVALAAVPSSLVLGSTQHVTTDIAAVPLFWVIPLGIYLLTYILTFASRQILSPTVCSGGLWVVALAVLLTFTTTSRLPIGVLLAAHVLLLFFAGMVCHGRLARSRPGPARLTEFYLAIALGGALGGAFNALLAPILFDTIVEYPIAIALALLLRERRRRSPSAWTLPIVVDGLVVALAIAAVVGGRLAIGGGMLLVNEERSFFGVHRLLLAPGGRSVSYLHGTTLHGAQDRLKPREPITYYHRETGVGRVMVELGARGRPTRIGVAGLGGGTLAAYGREEDHFTFYEIDPTVVEIARDPDLFTFLRDSPARTDIVLGDARLSIAREPDDTFNLLVLDTFSSDSVPTHMLTAEAIDLYLSKIRPDGLIAFHLTNVYLDLVRVLSAIAEARELPGLVHEYREVRAQADRRSAVWVVLARKPAALSLLQVDPGWRPLSTAPPGPLWTDTYSSLVGVLRDGLLARRSR